MKSRTHVMIVSLMMLMLLIYMVYSSKLTEALAFDDENLVLSIAHTDYIKINEFLKYFIYPMSIADIKNEQDIIDFAICNNDARGGGFNVPAGYVEEFVARFFGVESVNHDALYGETPRKGSYKNGFYVSIMGIGAPGDDAWYNVSELYSNPDGTYTAVIIMYSARASWFYEGREYAPSNRNDYVSNWVLKPGSRIVSGGSGGSDANIHKLRTDRIVISPYVYDGERTWQIIAINGWYIPKNLLSNSYHSAESKWIQQPVIHRDNMTNIDDETVFYVFTVGEKTVARFQKYGDALHHNFNLVGPMQVPAQLINGRVMLPLRIICEDILGMDVDYNSSNQKIKATSSLHNLVMNINNPEILVDGVGYDYGQSPVIINGYTLVPLRSFDEIVREIEWDPITQRATIYP